MGKKILLGAIIILIMPAIAASFWYGKNKIMSQPKAIENMTIISENFKTTNNRADGEKRSYEKLAIHEGKCDDDEKPDANGMFFYCIPELEIKFKVDKEMKNDLVYVFKENVRMFSGENAKVTSFSSKSLSQKTEYCKASEGPLGAIHEIAGINDSNNSEKDYSKAMVFKQFKHFFIFYSSPQSPCTDPDESDFKEIEQPQRIKFRNFCESVQLIN